MKSKRIKGKETEDNKSFTLHTIGEIETNEDRGDITGETSLSLSLSLFLCVLFQVLVSFINVILMYEMGGPSPIYLLTFLPIYCQPLCEHTALALSQAIVSACLR